MTCRKKYKSAMAADNRIIRHSQPSGQALIETAFLLVFVFGMLFALIQVFLLATTRITAFDAAHSMARAAAVGKNHYISAVYVLSSQKLGSQVIPIELSIQDKSNGIMRARITYLQKVMFPGFFSSIFSMLPGDAVCRMTKSPDTEFLNKSYPNASTD